MEEAPIVSIEVLYFASAREHLGNVSSEIYHDIAKNYTTLKDLVERIKERHKGNL